MALFLYTAINTFRNIDRCVPFLRLSYFDIRIQFLLKKAFKILVGAEATDEKQSPYVSCILFCNYLDLSSCCLNSLQLTFDELEKLIEDMYENTNKFVPIFSYMERIPYFVKYKYSSRRSISFMSVCPGKGMGTLSTPPISYGLKRALI